MSKSFSAKDFLKKNANHILASVILLIIFYAFSFFLVKGGKLNRFDFDMTVRIQGKVPLRLDPYLSILSFIGSFEVMVAMLAIFSFIKLRFKAVIPVAMFCLMHGLEIL